MRTLLALLLLLSGPFATAAPAGHAKYFFRVTEVKSAQAIDAETERTAKEVLEKELGTRAEFTADVGGATTNDAILAALKSRKLRGFDVSVKIAKLAKEMKAPRPGGRLPQLAVDCQVTVFGTTIQDAKLAFSGDGEASVEAEVTERSKTKDTADLVREALSQAVRQAVDEASDKLSGPQSAPLNGGKRNGKRKRP